jgi:CHAT domain-containing protein
MIKRYAILLAALLILVSVIFSGCATKMSLEEAKKVSIAMDDKTFTKPSRRISDILEVLNQPGQFDAKITQQFKSKAAALPPAKADDSTMAVFYHDRGEAARQLGQIKQALDDLRKALEYSRKTGLEDDSILLHLAIGEQNAGNFQTSLDLLNRARERRDNFAVYDHLINAYLQLGDIEKAEKISRESISVFNSKRRRNQNISRDAHIERIQYLVLEAQGKYVEAEYYERRGLALYNSQSLKEIRPAGSITSRISLSKNLSNQGRRMEAEIEARQALLEALGHAGAGSDITGKAVENLARLMLAQGRLNDAEQLGRAGLRILEASGVSPDSNLMCNARMFLGNVLSQKEDYVGAMKHYDLARAGMKENLYLYETKFIHNDNLMLTLLKTGRKDEAIKIISDTYNINRKRFGEKHRETIRILGLLGMANAMSGHNKEAYYNFAAAEPALIGREIRNSEVANKFQHIILEAYIDFLGSIYNTPQEKEFGVNALAESFRIANYLGGQTIQTAIGESSVRAAAAYDPELADLARKEQDANKQITAIQAVLSNALMAPADQQDANAIKTMRASIETLTKARNSILDEIVKRFPKYANFTRPQPITAEELQKHLHRGEALVSIFTTDKKTYVWVIPQQGERKFVNAPLGKKEQAVIVNHLREALDPSPNTFGDIPAFDLSAAYKLYSMLLKPTESAWINTKDLLVTIHGPLGQLPLSLLPTQLVTLANEKEELFANYRKVPWLIRKVSITMLPAASTLVTLRSLPEGDAKRKAFAGFGDPIFNMEQLAEKEKEIMAEKTQLAGRESNIQVRGVRITSKGKLDDINLTSIQLNKLERLPDTSEELNSIAKVLGASPSEDVFLGKKFSESRVKTMNLSDRKVIAFATHALIPGDLDGLDQPALATSSPAVIGEAGDGLLTMEEILKLKLNADWVVLSACNTGAAEGQGAEAISGIGKSFFYAGTRALLVTMWPVETTSARKLVTGIFQKQQEDKTLSRAQALRQSILNIIDEANLKNEVSGKIVSVSYAHPLFWAPFIIVGDPGGN